MKSMVFRLPMSNPGDMSALSELIETGVVSASDIVAVLGKTEGNGGVNDYTRGYFVDRLMTMLSTHLKEPAAVLQERIPCVLSGGTEGVLTPHYLVFARVESQAETPSHADGRLAIGTAFAKKTADHEIGHKAHALAIAEAVKAAIEDAGIEDLSEVHFVQVKTPCLTTQRIDAFADAYPDRATVSPEKSMALARAAGAFGVGLALGELPMAAMDDRLFLQDFEKFSNRASISSGVEVVADEIIVLGNSAKWTGNLKIAHRPMIDALDIEAVHQVVADLAFSPGYQITPAEQERVKAILVKSEPDRRGRIRGQRHTMLNDSDIYCQRHIRGALGGLVAGVMGDTRIFVSGGAEHQGPDGGGIVAVIAEAAL